MIKYFQGGIEEAKLYTKSSGKSIYPTCPDCGRIKTKKIAISTIQNEHNIGCSCSDNISIPQKIMFSLLEQLGMDFETEYNPEWIKPKLYDFYFKLNNKEYIIEMDGGFHKNDNKMNGQTKEVSKSIDDYKDEQAKLNGIEVIRIDCDYGRRSDLEYIKQNIISNNIFNELFNLSNVDWNKCREFACSNLVKVACECKRDNPNMSTGDIGKIMKMHYGTIRRYLIKGTKLGWCNYDLIKEKEKGRIKSGKMGCKSVEIFKNGISKGVFLSATELEQQSEELFGEKLFGANISSVCSGKLSQYKGYTFKFV